MYEYDHAGRLARVEHPDRTETRYEYGADGLLAVEHTPSGRRRYVYDHGGRVVTVTDDVAGVTSYDYDEVGRRVGEHHPDGSTVGYEWRGLSRLVAIDRIDHTGVRHHTPCAELPLTAPTADDVRLAFLGARVLDLDTHQFLSPDPLLPVPATPGAASAYTHAWYDPVNHVDPTGRRPIALDDWDTMRAREENGLVGEFVDAVLADPWATIAAIGITAAGATLCFTPLAPVGAGILIGVGSSAALGFATGTFDPRDVVVAGLFGALGGAAAQAARVGAVSWQASVATQAAIGGGEELARQTVAGEGYDAMSIGGSLLSAGVAPALDELLPADTIISRLARDTGGNVIAGRVDGMLTGEPLTLRGLAIDVSGGVITANSGHYIDRRLAVEVPELGADLDLRPSILDDPAALRATTRAVVSDLLVGTAVGRLSDQLHAAP